MEQITAVHISDLHIAHRIGQTRFGFIPGLHTHDIRLCVGLAAAFARLPVQLRLDEDDRVRVVASGDLTASGGRDEFSAMHTFLRSHWRLRVSRHPRSAGLNLKDDALETVPGNHDHWGGHNGLPHAFQPGVIGPHFKATPWQVLWRSAGGRLELELFGLDSNSGLQGSWINPTARGRIGQSELDVLEQRLKQSHPDPGITRVRAIILHHSPSYRRGILPTVVSPMVLDPTSVGRLIDIAARYGIAALLTGHTHDAYFHPFNTVVNGSARTVYELRSPTTLQGPASRPGPGFLLHQVWLDRSGHPFWSTWLYEWDVSTARFDARNQPRPWLQFRAD